jgi:D-aminopeptidase
MPKRNESARTHAKPRARDLGIPFDGAPARFNAITDVRGVEVGHVTLVRARGRLRVGRGPVRTGVTAILPRGRRRPSPVFAGYFALNGNGELTGSAWLEESGVLTTPIMITNTHSVGVVRDAVIAWQLRRGAMTQPWALPVVAETYDGFLNDINGFHVRDEHAWAALEGARSGRAAEGNVGGGTGMIGYGWKGGIGTASRRLARDAGGYTLGVLVQLNCGRPHELTVAGVPVGHEISPARLARREQGSIIIVAATDAPLLPQQLKRIARRLALGLARTGSTSGNGSGDIFIAFSTADRRGMGRTGVDVVRMLRNSRLDPLFEAAVQATEEAIINALVAAETMEGIDGRRVEALPHDHLQAVLRKYGRLVEVRGNHCPSGNEKRRSPGTASRELNLYARQLLMLGFDAAPVSDFPLVNPKAEAAVRISADPGFEQDRRALLAIIRQGDQGPIVAFLALRPLHPRPPSIRPEPRRSRLKAIRPRCLKQRAMRPQARIGRGAMRRQISAPRPRC